MQTGSKELIRDINFHLILEAIINEGPISRAGLAKHLGLTKATVSSIVQELLNSGLVREVGSGKRPETHSPELTSGGRIRTCRQHRNHRNHGYVR
jgi:Mn-dependent DtxR family transcriptional regulator